MTYSPSVESAFTLIELREEGDSGTRHFAKLSVVSFLQGSDNISLQWPSYDDICYTPWLAQDSVRTVACVVANTADRVI